MQCCILNLLSQSINKFSYKYYKSCAHECSQSNMCILFFLFFNLKSDKHILVFISADSFCRFSRKLDFFKLPVGFATNKQKRKLYFNSHE